MSQITDPIPLAYDTRDLLRALQGANPRGIVGLMSPVAIPVVPLFGSRRLGHSVVHEILVGGAAVNQIYGSWPAAGTLRYVIAGGCSHDDGAGARELGIGIDFRDGSAAVWTATKSCSMNILLPLDRPFFLTEDMRITIRSQSALAAGKILTASFLTVDFPIGEVPEPLL